MKINSTLLQKLKARCSRSSPPTARRSPSFRRSSSSPHVSTATLYKAASPRDMRLLTRQFSSPNVQMYPSPTPSPGPDQVQTTVLPQTSLDILVTRPRGLQRSKTTGNIRSVVGTVPMTPGMMRNKRMSLATLEEEKCCEECVLCGLVRPELRGRHHHSIQPSFLRTFD